MLTAGRQIMNEKIKELAEQADPTGWHKRWYSGINPRVMDPETKRFVELIVRECVAQCDKNKDHEWLGAGSKVSAFNIKQHFGVEE